MNTTVGKRRPSKIERAHQLAVAPSADAWHRHCAWWFTLPTRKKRGGGGLTAHLEIADAVQRSVSLLEQVSLQQESSLLPAVGLFGVVGYSVGVYSVRTKRYSSGTENTSYMGLVDMKLVST